MKKSGIKKHLRLLPGYIILSLWVLFTVVLISWIFCASLSTTKEIFQGDALKFATGLHFENYVRAWQTQNVSVFFFNSLLYASIATVLILLISAPAAYVLSRIKFRGNKLIQTSMATAMGIPLVMIVLPLFGIASNMGMLDTNISTKALLIFLNTGINVPYTIIFLLSFFSTISSSYEEAAIIDGCTREEAFWKIMLPLAQSGIITVSVFNFISVWNEYFMSLIFASGQDVRPLAVGLYSMINSMRYTGDWSGLFASVVIVFLPTFIIYILLSNRIIAGITQGGVKG